MNTYKVIFKPILDYLIAFLLIIVLSPLILLVSLLLLITNKGKVFFIQKRPGMDEKIFSLIKFRTMADKRDENNSLLPDKQRLTFIGKLIRKTSIDEIPQLLNVLKGEMSLIGPRPLLIEYLDSYTLTQKLRHSVKPGITGLAQVNGRNDLFISKRLKYDVFYAKNQSFKLDLRILCFTIKTLLFDTSGIKVGQTDVDDIGFMKKW